MSGLNYFVAPKAKRSGFTLIELLVVVAIIALLIAILLPSLASAREQAKTTVCQTRLRAWGIATHEYASLNNQQLPHDGGDGTNVKPIGRWDDPYIWFNGLTAMTKASDQTYNDLQLQSIAAGGKPLPKAGDNSLFVCPSAGEAAGAGTDVVVNGYFQTYGWKKVGVNMILDSPRNMLLCYAYNSQIRKTTMSTSPGQYPPISDPGDIRRLDDLAPLQRTVLFAEKRIRPDELKPTDINYAANVTKELTQTKIAPPRFTLRHKKGGNLVFADGHAEFWTYQNLNSNGGDAAPYNQPAINWTPGL